MVGFGERRGGAAKSGIVALALLGAAAGCSDSGDAVVAAEGAPPSLSTAAYTRVVGDDWRGYSTKAQLQAADYFWWYSSHEQLFGSVYGYVDLVPDPTFGQVVRITQPQQLSGSDGATPRLRRGLPAPMDRMWFRFRMKFSPGWTTTGPSPSGAANAYKIAFWTWANHDARGGIEYSNTNQYILTWSAKDRASGQYLQVSETPLPGSQSFGSATTEWSDGEWYEFVVHYERTSATTGNQRYWRRRLTSGGQIVDNPWVFHGMSLSGAVLPQVGAVELGANKNRTTAQAQHIFWGPWEVVDGTKFANPFGMPNVGGAPPPAPAPTLTGVALTPDTVTVAPGASVQFQSSGRYSDGSTGPVQVAYSATGGAITAGGLYTAGSTAGTFRVVAQAQGAAPADTSTVVVAAAQPTLSGVTVTPGTATVQTGGTVQFQASGRFSDGSTGPVPVTWSATGGSVSAGGLYTAGSTAGSFAVIARAQNGAADTSTVTVTAPAPPPPPPPPAGSYERLIGDDWRGYGSAAQLEAARYFSWRDSRSVYGFVALVPDATFGQVVRITQPSGTTQSPVLTRNLPAPTGKMWYRFRLKFAPGWNPSGASFGLAEWRWTEYNGAGSLGLGGSTYQGGFYAKNPSTNQSVGFTETPLSSPSGLGSATTEWTDGEWHEYVVYHEKTGANTAREHFWRRRLTSGGQIVSNPWSYLGFAISGAPMPTVRSIVLGGTWSRSSSATRQYFMGPWEVVDGAHFPNPWGMPNL